MRIFTDGSLLQIGFTVRDYIIVAAGLIIVFIVEGIEERDAEGKAVATEHSVRTRIGKLPYIVRVLIWLTLFTVIILAGAYGRGYNAAAFIYNRF